MNETQAVEKHLVTTLAAAVAVTALVSTRIYAGQAPQGTARPFILFSLNAGSDREAAGADRRIFVRHRYLIKAVTEGSGYESADQIADALDAALVGVTAQVTIGAVSYRVMGCWRAQPVRYVENVQGSRYSHVGGIYVVDCHGLP